MSVSPSEQGERRPALIFGAPAENFAPGSLVQTNFRGLRLVERGKVSDVYRIEGAYRNKLVLVRTDRKSTGDQVVGAVPDSGRILNSMAAYWMTQLQNIGAMRTHLIDVPHPNVTIAWEYTDDERVDYEVIWRRHRARSGSSTSIHKMLNDGNKDPYGIHFREEDIPEPNRPFPEHMGWGGALFTPTTKTKEKGGHDIPVTEDEFRAKVDEKHGKGAADKIVNASFRAFIYAEAKLREKGIVLPDTKMEFAMVDGQIRLIDEAFTPDTSRFWDQQTYEHLVAAGKDPVDMSKETLRNIVDNSRQAQGIPRGGAIPRLTLSEIHEVRTGYRRFYRQATDQNLPDHKVWHLRTIHDISSPPYIESQVMQSLKPPRPSRVRKR